MQSQKRDSQSTTETPTQRLATMILGRDLGTFVAERRANRRAWRYIARDLYEATGGEIDVTYETLRSWYPDERVAS